MSEVKIKRRWRSFPFTCHQTVSSATAIRTDDMAGGALHFDTTFDVGVTELEIYGSNAEDGTFSQIRKVDGTAAKIILFHGYGAVYPLPDEVFAVPFIKVRPNSHGGNGKTGSATLKS